MNRGFTLIEMIITIVVLGILGVFTFTFFGDYMNTYTQMRNRRSNHQEAMYIIERITRELRNAKTVSYTENSITFTMPRGTPADDLSTSITYDLDPYNTTKLRRYGNNSNYILIGDNIDPDLTKGFVVASPVTNCYRITVKRGTESYQTTVCPKNIPSGSLGFGGNYADNLQ